MHRQRKIFTACNRITDLRGDKLTNLLKKVAKQASFELFKIGQKFGIFIAPVHYYVPLSGIDTLRRTKASWNKPASIDYLPLSDSRQLEVLRDWVAPFESEYRGNPTYKRARAENAGPGFGYIEAQALHGMIRKLAPPRVIEVGSGVSTLCMLAAADINAAEGRGRTQITCIEPHPRDRLARAPVELVPAMVESVELSLFDRLDAGDLLFIDSSHALRPCGDVSRLYVEVLPRLKPGVHIHIHDVMIPYTFQRSLMTDTPLQWMETALLMAMLNHSSRYEITLCQSYLHYAHPGVLKEVFPEYRPQSNDGGLSAEAVRSPDEIHFPCSTYLRVTD